MAKISRRGLFGLFGGVAAAPLVKALPAAAEPVTARDLLNDVRNNPYYEAATYERYSGYDAINTTATYARIMSDNVSANNALLARLKAKGKVVEVEEFTGDWEDDD